MMEQTLKRISPIHLFISLQAAIILQRLKRFASETRDVGFYSLLARSALKNALQVACSVSAFSGPWSLCYICAKGGAESTGRTKSHVQVFGGAARRDTT